MSIDRLFDMVQQFRDTAHWRAAFGEPQQVEGRTIIPVAKISYSFATGFGSGSGPEPEEGEPDAGPAPQGEGAGAGGLGNTTPLGVIVVTPDDLYFEETADESKVGLAAMVVGGLFVWQFAKTVRAIFGK